MNILPIILAVAVSGFSFGRQPAPSGNEWQSPQELSLNKEYPHAWFFSFTDEESARKVLPENSSLWQSLDGDWKFNWAPTPEERPVDFFLENYDDSAWDDIPVPSNWNIIGLQEDGSQKYGTPIYVNMNVPFYHENKDGDWRLGVMRTPPENWTTFKCRNEVGSYRRTFTVPEEWEGNRIYVNFYGVDSFFYLWINGEYVGFAKNSRNLAQFDVSAFLKEGENVIAVEVYRHSDASNLEVQDMFRLPGIFRSVGLEAKPAECVRDIRVTPSMNSLNVEAEIIGEASSIDYSLYENRLYSDENTLVAEFPGQEACCELQYPEAKPWSAEEPNLYVLVGKLKDASGEVKDIFSLNVGFREVAIRDLTAEEDEFGLAGRYFLLNGKTFKMRGVNRHETDPERGHAVTRESMLEDVFLMKRANINHVRCSHYPDDPYWYYLCDRYGIYLMDEANNECHHYGYNEPFLAGVPEFRDAFVARMQEMVCQDYNHPSVVVWSCGNECGRGENFKYVYESGKAIDPMRPVQWEPDNSYSDFGCRQYPTVEWVANTASGKANLKYPYHINEFAHSMGNAMGDFADYWKYIDGTDFITGACVWDWVDQSLYCRDRDGNRFLASGGEFGDIPNDGQFVMNGLVFGDRTPKPQYYELAKVYQPLYTELSEDGCLVLFNRNYYAPAEFDAEWELIADGRVRERGRFDTGAIAPRSRKAMKAPCGKLPEGKECYLNVIYKAKEALPWAAKGSAVSREQLFLQPAAAADARAVKAGKVEYSVSADSSLCFKGRRFSVVFDPKEGTIASLKYRGRDVICPGEGPRLNLWRACINNDGWVQWDWLCSGIHNLQHKAELKEVTPLDNGGYRISFRIVSKAPNGALVSDTDLYLASNFPGIVEVPDWTDVPEFTQEAEWTVLPDGSIRFAADIACSNAEFIPARVGYITRIPECMQDFSYYGRGPEENYSDRCTAAFLGTYRSKVSDNFTVYTKPQDMCNHEQVRWARLGRKAHGCGIVFRPLENSWRSSDSGQPVMSVTAIQYSARDLFLATHPHMLPEPGDTYLNIDAVVTGIGGNSCGPRPQDKNIPSIQGRFAFEISGR